MTYSKAEGKRIIRGKKKAAAPAMKRAVVYMRYSSHKQTNSYSIEYQQEECLKYLERKGYKFVRNYIDEAKTGKKVAGRDAFNQMIHDGEQGEFDVIIVFSFSRAFRSTRDALNYIMGMSETSSVQFESVIEPIDLSNPHGKFSGTNLFAMHELQSDITAAHVKSGMFQAAQQGYYLGGYVPFGYGLKGTGEFSRGKERKKYTPHEVESKQVVEMYEMYGNGISLTAIQEHFKAQGVKGRRGDAMGLQTLARILKNEFYIGTREYSIDGYEPLYLENSVPAIVPPELWVKVQYRHESQAPKPRRTKRLYSLTGKINCAKCGAHMFGVYKGDGRSENWHYAYYHCATKKAKRTCDAKNIRKDKIEKYCISEIKKHVLNPQAMQEIAAEIVKKAGSEPLEAERKLNEAVKQREETAAIIKNLVKQQLKGEISQDILQELSAEYNKELAELDLQILQLENAAQNAITVEAVIDYLNELLEYTETTDEQLLKVLFDKLIDSIDVYDDKVVLRLIVSPYDFFRDKDKQGQPHVSYSLEIDRKQFNKL